LLDLCQLILFRVIDEGQAAPAQGVAKRKVGPLHLDAIAVHPPAGHVGKPGLIDLPPLDVVHIGPEPPQAVTDLADVVHAALTAQPRARQLSDIRRIVGRAGDGR